VADEVGTIVVLAQGGAVFDGRCERERPRQLPL